MNYLIYATGNPGKKMEMARHLGSFRITVKTMDDFGIESFDVPETATTLGENSVIKVKAYLEALKNKTDLRGNKFIVVSDDTGLEISGLNREPGIHVRRWKGYRMTDDEIVEHVLLRMKDLKGDDRSAQFRTVVAVGILEENGEIKSDPKIFEGKLDGKILSEPVGEKVEGFPFERLFFVTEWGMTTGGAHKLSQEEKNKLLNHRERAVTSAIPYFCEELGIDCH
jgi:XTP/dITP diphosphohydrolase